MGHYLPTYYLPTHLLAECVMLRQRLENRMTFIGLPKNVVLDCEAYLCEGYLVQFCDLPDQTNLSNLGMNNYNEPSVNQVSSTLSSTPAFQAWKQITMGNKMQSVYCTLPTCWDFFHPRANSNVFAPSYTIVNL